MEKLLLRLNIFKNTGMLSQENYEKLDEESLEELKTFNEYNNAEKIYLDFENILGKINENEKGYILAHLINLLKGEKE